MIKPIFSCMMNGVYQEFTVENRKEVWEALKRSEFYQSKYLSYSPSETRENAMEKLQMVRLMKSLFKKYLMDQNKNEIYFSLDDFITDNKTYNEYLKELLSLFTFEPIFAIDANMVTRYCESMLQYAKPRMAGNQALKDDLDRNLGYCMDGLQNTIIMREYDISLVEQDGKYHLRANRYYQEELKAVTPYQKQKVS